MNMYLARCVPAADKCVLVTAVTDRASGAPDNTTLLALTVSEPDCADEPDVFLLRGGRGNPLANEAFTGLRYDMWMQHAQSPQVAMLPIIRRLGNRVPVSYNCEGFTEGILRHHLGAAFEDAEGLSMPFVDLCVLLSATLNNCPEYEGLVLDYEPYQYINMVAWQSTLRDRLKKARHYLGVDALCEFYGLNANIPTRFPPFLRRAFQLRALFSVALAP